MTKFIIITDLRIHLLLTAVDIYKKCKDKTDFKFIISERIKSNHDYGDFFPIWYKKIKILIFRIFFDTLIVKSSINTFLQEDDYMGVTSSLCSVTCDSLATVQKYPLLYQNMVNLAKGAKEICQFIQGRKCNEIFIFNGRLASSEPIVRWCVSKNIKIIYYEYGSIFGKNYLLMDFPVHNSYKYGLELVKYYNNNILKNNLIIENGRKYYISKLSNIFTKKYIYESNKSYDVVIFLHSDHEYTSVNKELCGIEFLENYDFIKSVVERYGNNMQYAVRAHPNQLNDLSYSDTVVQIQRFCIEHSIDFFDANSKISSYSLIKNSKLIVVQLSSISVDAILLEKDVVIDGNNELKAILDSTPKHIMEDKAVLKDYVCKVLGMSEYLFKYEFHRKIQILAKLLFRFEWELNKRITYKKYLC